MLLDPLRDKMHRNLTSDARNMLQVAACLSFGVRVFDLGARRESNGSKSIDAANEDEGENCCSSGLALGLMASFKRVVAYHLDTCIKGGLLNFDGCLRVLLHA